MVLDGKKQMWDGATFSRFYVKAVNPEMSRLGLFPQTLARTRTLELGDSSLFTLTEEWLRILIPISLPLLPPRIPMSKIGIFTMKRKKERQLSVSRELVFKSQAACSFLSSFWYVQIENSRTVVLSPVVFHCVLSYTFLSIGTGITDICIHFKTEKQLWPYDQFGWSIGVEWVKTSSISSLLSKTITSSWVSISARPVGGACWMSTSSVLSSCTSSDDSTIPESFSCSTVSSTWPLFTLLYSGSGVNVE